VVGVMAVQIVGGPRDGAMVDYVGDVLYEPLRPPMRAFIAEPHRLPSLTRRDRVYDLRRNGDGRPCYVLRGMRS
jgi:hypothetical protein